VAPLINRFISARNRTSAPSRRASSPPRARKPSASRSLSYSITPTPFWAGHRPRHGERTPKPGPRGRPQPSACQLAARRGLPNPPSLSGRMWSGHGSASSFHGSEGQKSRPCEASQRLAVQRHSISKAAGGAQEPRCPNGLPYAAEVFDRQQVEKELAGAPRRGGAHAAHAPGRWPMSRATATEKPAWAAGRTTVTPVALLTVASALPGAKLSFASRNISRSEAVSPTAMTRASRRLRPALRPGPVAPVPCWLPAAIKSVWW